MTKKKLYEVVDIGEGDAFYEQKGRVIGMLVVPSSSTKNRFDVVSIDKVSTEYPHPYTIDYIYLCSFKLKFIGYHVEPSKKEQP